MDLNQLLYHHQMALMAANRAHRDGHPASNFDLPRYYAKRISEYRARRGAARHRRRSGAYGRSRGQQPAVRSLDLGTAQLLSALSW